MKPPYLPVHLSQPFSRWRPNGKGHKIREEIVATNLCMILPSNNKMASLNTFNNIRNIRIYFFSQIPSYLMHFEIFHFMYGALLEFIFQGKGQRKKGRLMMLPLPAFMLWRNITSKCVRWINCIRQLFTIFRLILISFHQTVMNGRQKISFKFFF